MNNIYSQLTESFPPEMEKRLNKGGANLVYVPISEVINRMNKVIGVENWSFTVKNWQQLGTSIVAQVSVFATIEGNTVTRDGVGGQKIKMSKNGDPVDIGDEVKGAVSDALKKAVQTLGIGLYLARSEEAIEIEQAMDATTVAPPSPVVSPKYTQFKALLEAKDENRAKIKSFWSNYGGGRPVPKPSEFTEEELDVLITQLISYEFEGSVVVETSIPKKTKSPEMPPRKDID
jgi:Rad52/22 family double-strand break repair protein